MLTQFIISNLAIIIQIISKSNDVLPNMVF